MEIRPVSPAALGDPAPATTPKAPMSPKPAAATPNTATRISRELSGPLAQQLIADSTPEPVRIDQYRIHLDIDRGTGRVVAEIRDKETGDLVQEVPPKTLLKQAALLKEALGTILDTPA